MRVYLKSILCVAVLMNLYLSAERAGATEVDDCETEYIEAANNCLQQKAEEAQVIAEQLRLCLYGDSTNINDRGCYGFDTYSEVKNCVDACYKDYNEGLEDVWPLYESCMSDALWEYNYCAIPTTPSSCGNSVCDDGENFANCPVDCQDSSDYPYPYGTNYTANNFY